MRTLGLLLVLMLTAGTALAQDDRPWSEIVAEPGCPDEGTLEAKAVDLHQQAASKKSSSLFKTAQLSYEKFLECYPESDSAYRMRYNFAELLYMTNQFDQAAEMYEETVNVDPGGDKLADAALNAIFSLEEHLKQNKKTRDSEVNTARAAMKKETDPEQKHAPIELNDAEKRLVQACDNYVSFVDDNDNTYHMMYKAAFLLQERNQFSDARERYEALIEAQPGSESARYAAQNILGTYELHEDWKGIENAIDEFLGNEELCADGRFKGEITNILANVKAMQSGE